MKQQRYATLSQYVLVRLKEAYDRAVREGKESFVFEGHEILTSYAKYLIEYLKNKLK